MRDVKSCLVCTKCHSAQPKFPLIQPDLPSSPWKKIGADLFHFKGAIYLVLVDYYSRFPVVRKLPDMKADTVSARFTGVLSEYGIPASIQTDFGKQFATDAFKESCRSCGIDLLFSFPYHHQTNGFSEKLVGVCKDLWIKALESNQRSAYSIVVYRTTSIDNVLPSPYELLTCRKPKSLLPNSSSGLKATHPRCDDPQQRNESRQENQARVYNRKVGPDQDILTDAQPFLSETL